MDRHSLARTDLFVATDEKYHHFRIPGLVVTASGHVLAYCEARYAPGDDWAPSDILLRRSSDGGETWDACICLACAADYGPSCMNNPVAIPDPQTGDVHFLFCHDYARAFYMRSGDDGRTFTEPIEITDTFKPFRSDYDWTVLAIGPGHGLALSNGRLIAPVWLSNSPDRAHRPNRAAVIYRDNHGETWQPGEIVPHSIPCCNESEAVQLDDGSVLMNMRNMGPARQRAVTVSADGVTGWSVPHYDNELVEPRCFGTICRYSAPPDRSRILFANPDNLDPSSDGPATIGERRNLTVRMSYDNCQTWPVSQVLDPGPSGYADLAVSQKGKILCLYERGHLGGRGGVAALTLARLGPEWLQP